MRITDYGFRIPFFRRTTFNLSCVVMLSLMRYFGMHHAFRHWLFRASSCVALILLISCNAGDTQGQEQVVDPGAIRPPVVAGSFYPGNGRELASMVGTFLNQAEVKPVPGRLVALMAPHAGYVFSGAVAAHAYKQLKAGQFKTVILLGLAHRVGYAMPKAAVFTDKGFATPLGIVPVDTELAQRIVKNYDAFDSFAGAHAQEHSLEVQLPFLQQTLKQFKIVPILMSNPGPTQCENVGQALAEVIGTSKSPTLLLISADMTHYPPEKAARRIDLETLEQIKQMDAKALHAYFAKTMAEGVDGLQCVMCAEGATMAGLVAARHLGADTVTVLNYGNSADSPHSDARRVVGYGAVAFSSAQPSGTGQTAEQKGGAPMEPIPYDKQELLRIARESVAHAASTGNVPEISDEDREGDLVAVFVTLHTCEGRLRGCIGSIQPQMPLKAAVKHFAYQAAMRDSRFNSVTPEEVPNLHIEISVLSPLRKVANADEIEPGKHGVIIERGMFNRGVFLPQVWEHFDTKEGFLSELADQKAHLPRNAWKDPKTTLYVFTVEAFEEEKEK